MEAEKRHGGYCWLDGVYHNENKLTIRAPLLAAGMVVREEVRTRGTRIAFFRQHYGHLENSLNHLGMDLQEILTAGEMEQQAINLINKNRYFGGNLLRISILLVDPSDPGNHHCLLECLPLDHPEYVLNRKGYVVGLYDDLNIQPDRFTGWFPRSSLLGLKARAYCRAEGLDDCILFNQRGHIAGSMESTLFARIREQVHTAPLRDGALSTVMREQIMGLLEAAGDPVQDAISLRALDIEKAEEIFLAQTGYGIRWVVAVDRHRYFNHTGAGLIKKLNEAAFGTA
jgi:branched-chain amino acid aminotransferase